ncbi:MAG: DUF4123 domain-containing protein [Rhodospirillaceae bacterium]
MPPRLSPQSLRRLFQVLYPESVDPEVPSQLYAVLDAARSPAIYRALYDHEGKVPIRCLYQGDMAEDLAEVAPYLVQLDREASFTTWLLENGWGESWGIFVRSDEPFDEVRRHFRKFTVVNTEAGKSLLFRFYDPRVLRTFLPTAPPEHLRRLFGGVGRYVLEDETGERVMEFLAEKGQLKAISWELRSSDPR